LIRHSGDIDIHMIRSDETPAQARRSFDERLATVPWHEFGTALIIAAVVTGICLATFAHTGYWAVALFYLLTVMLAATRLQRWPTLFLAALSALLWDFLFIPPRFTFYIAHLHDFMMFGAYFVIALVVGNLTSRLREREQIERRGQERSTSLYRLTKELAASRDLNEAMAKVVPLVRQSFQADAAIWLRDQEGLSLHPASTVSFSRKSESVASWAFQKKQAAGKSTDTLPDADELHLPLVAGDRAEGVLAVRMTQLPTVEQRELLDTFAAQLAVFVNKERALQESREAQVARQSQKLQKTLFDSVSHELKTPLAAMSVALQQPQPDRAELQEAVRRLTRTVDHLLDATRLESGLLQPVCEWCDPGELLREAVALAGLKEHAVKISVAKDLPVVFVDAHLIEQALAALLSNAAAHGVSNQPIEASASRDDSTLVFSVADHGPGLAPGEENKVFEKFYRGPGTPAGGLGLGLSIARQLVEAHSGQIAAQNREEGGSRFSIRLPIGKPMQLPSEATA
jgi:two-component system sensor histidine kinase KdpD